LDYYIGQVGIRPNDFWSQTWAENQRLGESYNIKVNFQWEQTRYLATMIHNVNCTKKSQMIKPEKLFPLPQDKMVKPSGPKSTIEEFEAFKEKARRAGVKI
jgi:hypothetical protein